MNWNKVSLDAKKMEMISRAARGVEGRRGGEGRRGEGEGRLTFISQAYVRLLDPCIITIISKVFFPPLYSLIHLHVGVPYHF